MQVIVVGAGEVGTHVAKLLSRDGNDVTVIEADPARCAEIERTLDASIIHGNATNVDLMVNIGVGKADLLVAATSNDEVNLVVSLIARIEGTKRRIVRLENRGLRSEHAKALHRATGADVVIDPDEAVAQEVRDLLTYPGATEVAHLADREVLIVAAELDAEAPMVGSTISEVVERSGSEAPFVICAVSRAQTTIIPEGDVTFEVGDEVHVVCKRRTCSDVMTELGLETVEHNRIMILGGGRTGEVLAASLLAKGQKVSIIDRNPQRAQTLAEMFPKALVLVGDITDASLLTEEDIGSYDAVVALTGEDDANILACLFAKKAGARETMAVLHRLELQHLLRDAGVDVAISPRTASANEVLRACRQGVAAVATSLDSDIEFSEVKVANGSIADGVTVADLELPDETKIAAIVRDSEARIVRSNTELRGGDHVVLVAHGADTESLSQIFTVA